MWASPFVDALCIERSEAHPRTVFTVSMKPDLAATLRSLLLEQQTAALATLHKGEPALSMVPYALLPEGSGFVIHVSRLAVHTADMLAQPAVSLLVVAPAGSAPSPQELTRASVQGWAKPLPPNSAEYVNAKERYVARFPSSEQTFSFSDFKLFVIEPRSVRFVGGFARATSILAREFVSIMRGAE